MNNISQETLDLIEKSRKAKQIYKLCRKLDKKQLARVLAFARAVGNIES